MASDAPEGGGSNAALLDVKFGWPFNFHLRINDPPTARSLSPKVANALGFGLGAAGIGVAVAGIGIGFLCYKHPEFVMRIVENAFTATGLKVGSVTPGSILVELHCYTEESFRSFMEDFEARKVQKWLNKEFENSGYIGEELEVTITNYKEADKFLEQISRQPTSGTGNIRKRKVSDDIVDSTVAETKFRKTSKNPPKVAEDVTVLRNKDLPAEAKSLDHGQLPIDILLLTVKDCEFLACLSFMTSFTKRYENDLGYVYIGSMSKSSVKMKIAVMKCRMGAAGPGGASGVVRDAVKALTPKAVFCVGYCGGLQPVKVKLGDVVISEKLITYAPSKVTENGIEELGDRVPPSRKLGRLILSAAGDWEAPLHDPAELEVEVKRGALLSGPQLVDNNELREALIKRFPNGIAIEMEGEGVYGAAYDLGVEWIIIKGVSDFADGTKSETNSWRPFASLMAASLVAHILKNPIIFEKWGHYNDGKSSLLSSLGERVLQSSHREHASQSNDSKTPVSSGKVIKDGVPTSDDLQHLSLKLGTSWKPLARCLKFDKASITVFHKENEEFTEKALSMLQKWKAKYGSGATFRVLHDALCDERVCERELAEQFCYC